MSQARALACERAPAPREDLVTPIAGDLEIAEQIFDETLASDRAHVQALVGHLRQYRGKRLRPTLLLLTARACGGVTRAHHILAAVVEMVHMATLVHDDVLDKATMRRHVPTMNARRGNHVSVLLGDFLFTHAFHLSASVGDIRAPEIIGAATNRVCEGELHQVSQRGNLALQEEEYFEIIDAKTAELTACCCRLGALFSGADAEVVEALAGYGRSLGVAFQIVDDLLDLVGEERVTGKSLGTDLAQQKLTLPLIHLLNTAAPAHGARLREFLRAPGNRKRTDILSALADNGAIDYARSRAEGLAARAAAHLDCLPPSAARSILRTLTDRVVQRTA